MPSKEFLVVERPRPHVTLVTLDRPERMNAMAFDVMIPFREALEEIHYDNETRVVVVTGAGRGFCSGADLTDSGTIPNIEGLTVPTISMRAMELLDDVILTIRKLHQPVIGAINGAAIGGGFCLSLAFDIRIASEAAYFRAAGINNGLSSTELGLSYLLPRAVGSSRAFEIMLTGRDVDAFEAERIGLVSRTVVGTPVHCWNTCYETAERIIGWSRAGVEIAKRVLWAGLDSGSLEAHIRHEGIAQLYVRNLTGNFEEMIRARREGPRPPIYAWTTPVRNPRPLRRPEHHQAGPEGGIARSASRPPRWIGRGRPPRPDRADRNGPARPPFAPRPGTRPARRHPRLGPTARGPAPSQGRPGSAARGAPAPTPLVPGTPRRPRRGRVRAAAGRTRRRSFAGPDPGRPDRGRERRSCRNGQRPERRDLFVRRSRRMVHLEPAHIGSAVAERARPS